MSEQDRKDLLDRLKRTLHYIDHSIETVGNLGMDEFSKKEDVVYGVSFAIIQVYETLNLIRMKHPETKDMMKYLAWAEISAFRNRMVHDYGNVQLKFVYDVVTVDFKQLRKTLLRYIGELG